MRKALIVGIDHYENVASLYGCVSDAESVHRIISAHADNSRNFNSVLKKGTSRDEKVTRRELKDLVTELFKGNNEIALFYFAGHGHIESTGGYLMTSECRDGDDGFSVSELMKLANSSKATNRIIILDCCHSGIAANADATESKEFNEGVTVLTASGLEQYSKEENGTGVFTRLLVDALNGSAANLLGDVTPGSVYAHIDQSLGPWQQRPLFKTNVNSFTTLRKTTPPIELSDLHQLVQLFERKDDEIALDSSFEPTSPDADPVLNKKFAVLQKLNRVNLVVPVGAAHMYYAAMEGKSCKLTVLGQHYWGLVKSEKI